MLSNRRRGRQSHTPTDGLWVGFRRGCCLRNLVARTRSSTQVGEKPWKKIENPLWQPNRMRNENCPSSHLSSSLKLLGWSEFFADQVQTSEAHLVLGRIASVHRARIEAIDVTGPVGLTLPANSNSADYAVRDWVLVDPLNDMLVSRLDRKSVFQRRSEGGRGHQLLAANVDSLLIVTSCNADFNLARLERYLIMANQTGSNPVVDGPTRRILERRTALDFGPLLAVFERTTEGGRVPTPSSSAACDRTKSKSEFRINGP